MKSLMEIWSELKPGQRLYVADAQDYITDEEGNLKYRFTGPMTEARVLAYQDHRVLNMFRTFDENSIYCVVTGEAEGGEA